MLKGIDKTQATYIPRANPLYIDAHLSFHPTCSTEAAQSVIAMASSMIVYNSSQPSYLTSIPPEVRNIILEYCLVVHGPINPHPIYYESPDVFSEVTGHSPDMALLKVNRLLNKEATAILYSKNTWRISTLTSWPLDIMSLQLFLCETVWGTHRQLIRKVTTSFDLRDMDPRDTLDLGWTFRIACNFPEFRQEHANPVEAIHEKRLDNLIHAWMLRNSVLQRLPLTSVHFNFGYTFCPVGVVG